MNRCIVCSTDRMMPGFLNCINCFIKFFLNNSDNKELLKELKENGTTYDEFLNNLIEFKINNNLIKPPN